MFLANGIDNVIPCALAYDVLHLTMFLANGIDNVIPLSSNCLVCKYVITFESDIPQFSLICDPYEC